MSVTPFLPYFNFRSLKSVYVIKFWITFYKDIDWWLEKILPLTSYNVLFHLLTFKSYPDLRILPNLNEQWLPVLELTTTHNLCTAWNRRWRAISSAWRQHITMKKFKESTPWSIKTCHFIFHYNSQYFLMDFSALCTNGME